MCRSDRIIRNGKRQLGNHNVTTVRPGQVDAFEKTRQTENGRAFTAVNERSVLGEQGIFTHPILHEDVMRKYSFHNLQDRLHLSARGKQQQRSVIVGDQFRNEAR